MYLPRLPLARHDRANQMGRSRRVVATYPSRSDIERIRRSSTAGTCVLTLTVNPDTSQVETVKVDELTCALRLLDAFHLTFTSGKQLFTLEPASVTTAEAHRCISPLGGRIWLNGAYGGCSSMVVSSSVASSSARLWWSVWLLQYSRARSGVARKWPRGALVIWSASASSARGV